MAAFILNANGELLRDLWPNRLARTKSDSSTLADLKPWQVMPTAFEELADWADVEADDEVHKVLGPSGLRTPYTLLQSTTLDDKNPLQRHRTLVRFHGFLAAFCIRPLGNWTGKPADAKGAAQFVTIVGKGCNAAFQPQVDVVSSLDTYIYRSLHGEPTRQRKQGSINFRRRVFSRVNLTSTGSTSSAPLPDSDQQAMESIKHEWKVTHRLLLGMQRQDGKIRRAKEVIFAKGDFVEISAFAEITKYRDPETRNITVDVQYAPHEIIRLWSSHEAQAILSKNDTNLSSSTSIAIAPTPTSYDLDKQDEAEEAMPDQEETL